MTDFSHASTRSPRSWLILLAFLVVVIGVGGLIGVNNLPGPWYEGLTKPPFNPPNWIFSPVWTTLYVLIAVAGWRIFTRAPKSAAMVAWAAQMVLNWVWSPVWFTLHALWPAFFIALAMLAAIVAFIVSARRIDPLAPWLFVPYAAWVSFASLLSGWIAAVN